VFSWDDFLLSYCFLSLWRVDFKKMPLHKGIHSMPLHKGILLIRHLQRRQRSLSVVVCMCLCHDDVCV
jgi:hypothetical protein